MIVHLLKTSKNGQLDSSDYILQVSRNQVQAITSDFTPFKQGIRTYSDQTLLVVAQIQ